MQGHIYVDLACDAAPVGGRAENKAALAPAPRWTNVWAVLQSDTCSLLLYKHENENDEDEEPRPLTPESSRADDNRQHKNKKHKHCVAPLRVVDLTAYDVLRTTPTPPSSPTPSGALSSSVAAAVEAAAAQATPEAQEDAQEGDWYVTLSLSPSQSPSPSPSSAAAAPATILVPSESYLVSHHTEGAAPCRSDFSIFPASFSLAAADAKPEPEPETPAVPVAARLPPSSWRQFHFGGSRSIPRSASYSHPLVFSSSVSHAAVAAVPEGQGGGDVVTACTQANQQQQQHTSSIWTRSPLALAMRSRQLYARTRAGVGRPSSSSGSASRANHGARAAQHTHDTCVADDAPALSAGAGALKHKPSLAQRVAGSIAPQKKPQRPGSSAGRLTQKRTEPECDARSITTNNSSHDLKSSPPDATTGQPPRRHIKQKPSLSGLRRWSSLLRAAAPTSSSPTHHQHQQHARHIAHHPEHRYHYHPPTFTFRVPSSLMMQLWAEALSPHLAGSTARGPAAAAVVPVELAASASASPAPTPALMSRSTSSNFLPRSGSLQHSASSGSFSLLVPVGRQAHTRHRADASSSSPASSPASALASATTSALLGSCLLRSRPSSMSDLALVSQSHLAGSGNASAACATSIAAPMASSRPTGHTHSATASPRMPAMPHLGLSSSLLVASSRSGSGASMSSQQPSLNSYDFGMNSSSPSPSPASNATSLVHCTEAVSSSVCVGSLSPPFHATSCSSSNCYCCTSFSSGMATATSHFSICTSGGGGGGSSAGSIRSGRSGQKGTSAGIAVSSPASSPMEVLDDDDDSSAATRYQRICEGGKPISALALLKLRRSSSLLNWSASDIAPPVAAGGLLDEHCSTSSASSLGLGLELGVALDREDRQATISSSSSTSSHQDAASLSSSSSVSGGGRGSAGRFAGNILRLRSSRASLNSLRRGNERSTSPTTTTSFPSPLPPTGYGSGAFSFGRSRHQHKASDASEISSSASLVFASTYTCSSAKASPTVSPTLTLSHSASLTAIDRIAALSSTAHVSCSDRLSAGFSLVSRRKSRIPSPLSSPREELEELPPVAPHGVGSSAATHPIGEKVSMQGSREVRMQRILPPDQLIATLDEIRRLDPLSAAAARDDLERLSANGGSPLLEKRSLDLSTPRSGRSAEGTPQLASTAAAASGAFSSTTFEAFSQTGSSLRKSADLLLLPSDHSVSSHEHFTHSEKCRPMSMIERSPLAPISNLSNGAFTGVERSLPCPPRPVKRASVSKVQSPQEQEQHQQQQQEQQQFFTTSRSSTPTTPRKGPKAPLISPPRSPARAERLQAAAQSEARSRSGSTSTFCPSRLKDASSSSSHADSPPSRHSIDGIGDSTLTNSVPMNSTASNRTYLTDIEYSLETAFRRASVASEEIAAATSTIAAASGP